MGMCTSSNHFIFFKAEAEADNDHATMSLGEFVAVAATSRVAASATARRAFFTSQVRKMRARSAVALTFYLSLFKSYAFHAVQ